MYFPRKESNFLVELLSISNGEGAVVVVTQAAHICVLNYLDKVIIRNSHWGYD